MDVDCLAGERDGLHVLALDSSEHQIEGSERRAPSSQQSPNLTSRAFWLGEGPPFKSHPGNRGATYSEELQFENIISEWLDDVGAFRGIPDQKASLPIVFVALHACGSLTPGILRKMVQLQPDKSRRWHVSGAVIAGCCYNLLGEEG